VKPKQPSFIVDLKDIKKIVELMDEHELSFFHLEKEDFNLKLKKGVDAEAIQAAMPMQMAPAPVAAPAVAPAAAVAPAVGDSAPASASVSEGDTICIIEAMKVMNEIKAEKSGTITAILVDDSTPVQFGDTLFTIK